MANEDLLIKVRAETDKATAEIKRLNGEIDSLTKQTKKSASSLKENKSAFEGISKSADGVSSAFNKITLGLGGLGVAVKGVEFAKLAADAEQAADAFEKVVTDMGYIAEEEFKKIKEASKGLVSDADIKQSATTAISLGVPLEKLAGLMEVAKAKAREMGTDTKSAFNDLAIGIGRGSPMILDNLGLTLKLEDANKKYADSLGKNVNELTKQEKQIALTNAVIEAATSSVKRFEDAGLSSSEKMQKMSASIENLKVAIGEQLLPALVELTEKATTWADSLTESDMKTFSNGIDLVATSISSLLSAAKDLNDVFAPDALFGEGVGVFDLFARGTTLFEYALTKLVSRVDNVNGAFEKLTQQQNEVAGLATAVDRFAGDSTTEFNALQEAIASVMDANEKQIQQWNSKQPEIYADKIKQLSNENSKLVKIYADLVAKRPYEEQKKSAEETSEAIKGLSEKTKQYTETEIKELKKLNDQRVKDAEVSIRSLESSERKLATDIVKINKDLVQQLNSIANDRFKMNQDIESQISELKRSSLTEDQAYYDRQREAEQALSDAKIALKQGEYEKYKYFIDQYKQLVSDGAGQEIKAGEQVLISKEETTRRTIEGLKQVQQLNNAFYDQQEADARAAHDAQVQQKQIELDATIALMEAQKASLELMKKLAEELTGKKLDIDTSAVDASIEKAKSLKIQLDNVQNSQTRVNVDSTTVDNAKQKVEQLKTLTLNGVTLEVNANTTPADFGIKKLITVSKGEQITMDVNPEYEQAEKELDSFRSGESGNPVVVDVDADTGTAETKIDTIKEPTESTHTVDANTSGADAAIGSLEQTTNSTHTVIPNTSAAQSAIDRLKQPTSSRHTVYESVVSARAGGGVVPKYAAGGRFRGSGRVPGYDPTDSDKVNALLTGGEYVIKRKAVDAIGLPTLNRLNNIVDPKSARMMKVPKLPGYADGGLVGVPQSNKANTSPGLGDLGTITLKVGDASHQVLAPRAVAEALQIFINTEGGL